MTDTADLLLDLKDIHEPLAPATSSALLLIVVVLCSVFMVIGFLGYLLWRRKTLNRSLQHELASIKYQSDQSALHQLAVLLRRVMHHVHGDAINKLQNEQWLDSLDSTFATDYFKNGRGSVFGESLYRAHETTPETDVDIQQLCADLHKLIGRVRLRPPT